MALVRLAGYELDPRPDFVFTDPEALWRGPQAIHEQEEGRPRLDALSALQKRGAATSATRQNLRSRQAIPGEEGGGRPGAAGAPSGRASPATPG